MTEKGMFRRWAYFAAALALAWAVVLSALYLLNPSGMSLLVAGPALAAATLIASMGYLSFTRRLALRSREASLANLMEQSRKAARGGKDGGGSGGP